MARVLRKDEVGGGTRTRRVLRPLTRRRHVSRPANDNKPSIWWRAKRYLVRSAAAGALGALVWSIINN